MYTRDISLERETNPVCNDSVVLHYTFISAFIMSEKQNCESEVWYKQKTVIELLTHEGEKPKKIHERLNVVYGEDVFDTSMVRYWACESQKKC